MNGELYLQIGLALSVVYIVANACSGGPPERIGAILFGVTLGWPIVLVAEVWVRWSAKMEKQT